MSLSSVQVCLQNFQKHHANARETQGDTVQVTGEVAAQQSRAHIQAVFNVLDKEILQP